MNKVISFILGAISMLVVVLAINFVFLNDNAGNDQALGSDAVNEVSEPNQSKKVDKKIAFVNNDLGIAGTNVNVASSLIDNMVSSLDYKVETTTYSDAVSGLENNGYAAYIVFGSNYSTSLFNVSKEQLPARAKINVRVNANLSQEQQTEVYQVLLSEYNYIHDTISYVYITYLLDEVHNSQNNIGTVVENEEYMNSIASSVSEYSTNIVNQFKDYLDKSEKTEIELDTTNIESLYDQNLKQVENVQGLDVDKVGTDIESQQDQFMTAISQSMLTQDMEASKLDLTLKPTKFESVDDYPQLLNDILINNTNVYNNVSLKLNSINDKIATAMLGIDGGDITIPDIDNIKVLHILETIAYTSLDGKYNFANIESLESDPTYESTFNATNGFILDYANWYNSNKGITPTPCVDNECFADYNTSYSDKFPIWKASYENFKSSYQVIATNIKKMITNTIPKLESALTSAANNFVVASDYGYIGKDNTIAENYKGLKSYCQTHPKPSSFAGQYGCSVNNLAVDYVGASVVNTEYNKNIAQAQKAIDGYNEENAQDVATQNQAVDDANSKVTEALVSRNANIVKETIAKGNKINGFISNSVSTVNKKLSGFNSNKDGFVDKTLTMLSGYEEQLNTSISNTEKSLYNDRKESSDAAKGYNEEYSNASNYYSSNVNTLNSFASILPNTRNGAEANLYLYDYIVNPLDIILQEGDKTKDSSTSPLSSDTNSKSTDQTTSSKGKLMLNVMLGVMAVVGVLLFVLVKAGEEDDE